MDAYTGTTDCCFHKILFNICKTLLKPTANYSLQDVGAASARFLPSK